MPIFRQPAKLLIILEGAKVNDVPLSKWQMVGRAAGCKQQFVVGVFFILHIPDKFFLRVEQDHFAVQMEIGSSFLCLAPDLFNRTPLPQPLGKIGPHIGWIRLHAEHADRAVHVQFADALRRCVACQSAPDDQILVNFHRFLRFKK